MPHILMDLADIADHCGVVGLGQLGRPQRNRSHGRRRLRQSALLLQRCNTLQEGTDQSVGIPLRVQRTSNRLASELAPLRAQDDAMLHLPTVLVALQSQKNLGSGDVRRKPRPLPHPSLAVGTPEIEATLIACG